MPSNYTDEKGFFYSRQVQGEPVPPITLTEHQRALARPEHQRAETILLHHDLIVLDKKGKPNRFGVQKLETFPSISKQFRKAFEDKDRKDDELYVLNYRGTPLINIVADAKKGIVLCLRKVVPLALQPGMKGSDSPGGSVKNLSGLDAVEVVEKFDGSNVLDQKNGIHFVARETLARIGYCITTIDK